MLGIGPLPIPPQGGRFYLRLGGGSLTGASPRRRVAGCRRHAASRLAHDMHGLVAVAGVAYLTSEELGGMME
jgi:hypothetical protein